MNSNYRVHIRWRKSSYSAANGECVEVGRWSKSSYSHRNGSCVEVAPALRRTIAVRDSKRPNGDVLAVPCEAFAALLRRVR